MPSPLKFRLLVPVLIVFICGLPLSGQNSQQISGSINGTVVDRTGAVISGARVQFSENGQAAAKETLVGADGQFSFSEVAPGSFQLTITATGFATQTFSGSLQAGEVQRLLPITLAI